MRYCLVRNHNPLFRNCSNKFFVFRNGKTCPVAHLSLDTGALKTTEGKAEVPSFHSEVERTTPAAPPKERDHLLDGAATPPFPRSSSNCPAGQTNNSKKLRRTKTKGLWAQLLERGLRLFHPLSETSAPAAVASQLFLCGAATPPVPGVPGGDHVFRAVFGLTWSQS